MIYSNISPCYTTVIGKRTMTEVIQTFVFEHEDLNNKRLELPVMIPHDGCVRELASIFLSNNEVPVYLEKGKFIHRS